MDTLHPVLKRGAMFSDWNAFPQSLFADRHARTQAAVTAAGDDAWILYGDAQHYGELAYVTHFLPRLRSSLALIAPNREPTVLTCVGSRDIPAMQVLTWVSDIQPYWRLPENLPRFITDAGFANRRIGLVGVRDAMPIGEWTAIRSALPNVGWAFRDAEFAAIRRPEDSIAQGIRRAKALVEESLRTARPAFAAGNTVRAAAAEIERALRKNAAEDLRILVGASAHGGHLAPPGDEAFPSDGGVCVVVACELQRCWAEAAITIPSQSLAPAGRRLAALAEGALNAMSSALTVDTTAGELWERAMSALESQELRTCAEAYGLGHGIGLDAHESPEIRRGGGKTFDRNAGVALHVVLRSEDACAVAGTTLVRSGRAFEP